MTGKPRTRTYKNHWFAKFHYAASSTMMSAAILGTLSVYALPHVRW